MEKLLNITPIHLNAPDPEKQKKAKGVRNIDENILQSNFITLIVGKPGSGKSFILREFILNKKLYNKKFSYVLFITPSKFEDPEIVLDDLNYKPNIDIDWILSRLAAYKKFNDDKHKMTDSLQIVKNILIIFDDVIGELKKLENDPRLIGLFYNRRHHLGDNYMISIIVTTQKYVLCPPKIRSVLTSVISFPLMKMDWQRLENECIFDSLDKKLLNRVYKDLFSEAYSFIYIRLDNSKVFYKFEKCLNIL